MELSFANGVQEYTVHGVKGDVIIRFNPTDGAFIPGALCKISVSWKSIGRP